MAKNPIFNGISAIEAAGGIDGFVREVLAEAQRLSHEKIKRHSAPTDAERCKQIVLEFITDVMFRRLEDDVNRGFSKRLGEAVASCTKPEQMDAASNKAFAQAKAWADDLIKAVQIEIFGVHLLND